VRRKLGAITYLPAAFRFQLAFWLLDRRLVGVGLALDDILFVIDRERFALAFEQAQTNVEQSLWSSKLAQDNADRDAQVMKNDSGAISATTAEASRTKAGEAGAALQLAQSQLAVARLNLERSTVRSPVNGFVTNLTATVGNYAGQGTGVLALVDSDSFYVYAYFMETKLPAIKIGSDAEVRLMAGGAVLRGKVQGLSRAIANPTDGRSEPCHSSSAMRWWSASVFALFEVTFASAFACGSSGSARRLERISIGPNPTIRSVIFSMLTTSPGQLDRRAAGPRRRSSQCPNATPAATHSAARGSCPLRRSGSRGRGP
jgi:hypothetical protein